MKGEALANLRAQIYREMLLQGDGRVVLVEPVENQWSSLTLANHNVFRLNAAGKVVWQVQRAENPTHASWDTLHELARRRHAEGSLDGDYSAEGFWDPFQHLGLDETRAQSSEPKGVYRPGCVIYLLTRWWAYVLDVETGVATCTGEQVK